MTIFGQCYIANRAVSMAKFGSSLYICLSEWCCKITFFRGLNISLVSMPKYKEIF